jgi:hypothetical protein
MKNKKTVLLVLLLAAVAAYFYFNKSNSTISGEFSDFSIKDTASVSKIFISTLSNESVNLQRNKEGIWVVNGQFPARKDAIHLLLETFYRIDVLSPVPQPAFENVVKQLAVSGVKVEIYLDNASSPKKIYYVGQATENHKGTYMLLEQKGKKSTRPFITYVPGFYGYLSTRFFTNENLWRDREIFGYQPAAIQSLKINYNERPENSFSIHQHNGRFTVKDGTGAVISGIENTTINEYLNRFKSVHYEYIETKLDSTIKDSVLSSMPLHEMEIIDQEGVKRRLTTFYKPLAEETYDVSTGELLTHNLDRCYGLIDGSNFVAIQYIILDPLLITAADLKTASAVDK